MIFSNLDDMQNATDPTCSGAVRVHWAAYLPDGYTLIDGNGDDLLREIIMDAIVGWSSLRIRDSDEDTHIFTQVFDVGEVWVDDDNRGCEG